MYLDVPRRNSLPVTLMTSSLYGDSDGWFQWSLLPVYNLRWLHVFCVTRHNSLPVTWVTRSLQGDLGGCFHWSLLSVGLHDLKESTIELWAHRNLWLVQCGVLFTLSFSDWGVRCPSPLKIGKCSLIFLYPKDMFLGVYVRLRRGLMCHFSFPSAKCGVLSCNLCEEINLVLWLQLLVLCVSLLHCSVCCFACSICAC